MKMESLLTVNYTKYAIHNSLNSQMHSEKAFIQEHLHGEKKKKATKNPNQPTKKLRKTWFLFCWPLQGRTTLTIQRQLHCDQKTDKNKKKTKSPFSLCCFCSHLKLLSWLFILSFSLFLSPPYLPMSDQSLPRQVRKSWQWRPSCHIWRQCWRKKIKF